MSSASVRFGTKAYACARYFLRPGKCFKYIDQRGEDVTEHVYEVMGIISVLRAVKRYQKRSQDLPGVQYFEFDAERE